MTISKENIEKTKKAILEHRRKMETDPDYRKKSERIQKILEKELVTFGDDEKK